MVFPEAEELCILKVKSQLFFCTSEEKYAKQQPKKNNHKIGFPKWQKLKAAFIFKYFFYFSSHRIVECWYFIFQSRREDVNTCKCLIHPFFNFVFCSTTTQ